jgi:hypothetical protein
MVQYTQEIPLNKVTSSDISEVVIDRSNLSPIKWFTITVDNDAYIGINKDASSETIYLKANESYTSPESIRCIEIAIMRASATNVTLRGSAWA